MQSTTMNQTTTDHCNYNRHLSPLSHNHNYNYHNSNYHNGNRNNSNCNESNLNCSSNFSSNNHQHSSCNNHNYGANLVSLTSPQQ